MTNHLNLFSKRSLLVIAALAASFTPAARAQDALCAARNMVMKGTYVMSGSGSIPGVGPLASVGLVVYNGDGTAVVASVTTSVNGTVIPGSGTPGTFTVNPDCTGSKTFGSGASAQHFNFVISPDGSKITWIVSDTGVVMTGIAERIRR